ncbi:hypothetical protein QJS04_geneDACA010660 [Acorus gramineus]|uniref:Uncharacterized protein n=1 Tax=Acorus gramineus TaxID=55184 RepID=A0AAV9AL33_ACOGR|nr:hypothetical protein QJS04_geneDACA010660 [Acorus gramineus]
MDYENFEVYICKAYKGNPPKFCESLPFLKTRTMRISKYIFARLTKAIHPRLVNHCHFSKSGPE